MGYRTKTVEVEEEEYFCDLCETIKTEDDDQYQCRFCKKQVCYDCKRSPSPLLEPSYHIFVCKECYPKTLELSKEASLLNIDFTNKLKLIQLKYSAL